MPRSKLCIHVIASALAGLMSSLSPCRDGVHGARLQRPDGTAIYGRTMEWGASDLKSELALVPHDTSFKSALARARPVWNGRAVTASSASTPQSSLRHRGWNEPGLTVGFLFFPGLPNPEQTRPDILTAAASTSPTICSVNFATVAKRGRHEQDSSRAQSRNRRRSGRSPMPHIVTDATGASIVIEYTKGGLSIMTIRSAR